MSSMPRKESSISHASPALEAAALAATDSGLPPQAAVEPSRYHRLTTRSLVILILLFFIAIVNYFDRQSLSVVAPRFQQEMHLSDEGYGHVVSLFLIASAFAYALSGFLTDVLGTKWSMALFVGWWSLAEAATTFTFTVLQLSTARFFLGLGEPGLWVAAPKAVGEIFPQQRRSLAISLYTLGATVGAVIAIPVIAMVTTHLPWRSIFLLDGAVGLLWVPIWLFVYPSSVKAIQKAVATKRASFFDVLRLSKTWKLLVARGMTDPFWYFYLFWFPKYLQSTRHLSLPQLAHLGWLVYLGAGVGTLGGGLMSSRRIRTGTSAGASYRRVMLLSAALIPLSPCIAWTSSVLLAVFLATVIAMAHMAWLVNLTATVLETFPAFQVGTASGWIAAGSAFGGMISSELIGHWIGQHGFTGVFIVMGCLHPIALLLLWSVFRSPESLASVADVKGNS